MVDVEREFEFGGFLLSLWHLESSVFGRMVADLSEDDRVEWKLFEVRDLGNRGLSDRLMLQGFDRETGDMYFYFVEEREDALSIVRGLVEEREHIFVGSGTFIEID